MFARTEPDQFARRPPPAFRAKQARTLMHDVLKILHAEVENPFVLKQVERQVRQLIEYSIDGVVNVERNGRQLRAVLRTIDELHRASEGSPDSSPDDPFADRYDKRSEPPRKGTSHQGATRPQNHDQADRVLIPNRKAQIR